MKKSTVYTVDVKLDVCGVVQESQCECGAGMGPEAHCKHLCVIFYALSKAAEGIVCSETCSQKLQTFHHVKNDTGSHVKMEQLKLCPSGSLQRVCPSPADDIPDAEYEDLFSGM